MDATPSELGEREMYSVLLGAVGPRPIAWVSTISPAGVSNLAPFSFFNVVCAAPPLLGFAPSMRAPVTSAVDQTSGVPKDTLRNIRETKEFVVSVVTYELAEAMNLTSGDYDAATDEFKVAQLAAAPSRLVRPHRVADSPVSFECKLHQILDFNSGQDGGSLVIGEIVSIHIGDQYLKAGQLDRNSLDLIGRMGGVQYSRTTQRFEMVRPKVG
jgi:flavin reductase (DIM6/NTAB) family NADH-FMN oxidoreductase RutF